MAGEVYSRHKSTINYCYIILSIYQRIIRYFCRRYMPHVNKNLSQPRAPASVVNFTAYMNSLAIFVRGGDVSIKGAR